MARPGSTVDDPFTTLGLTDRATPDDVRAARRRLAKQHHPDRGGDPVRMRALNDAAAAALAWLAAGTTPGRPAPGPGGRGGPTGVTSDVPSFTVEALPVETFEALVVVSSWLGEVLDDDPPYRLDVQLRGPIPCWCRLELVPDAGASTVSINVGAYDGGAAPDVESIRDVWVDQLNRLDWDEPFSKA